MHIGRYTISGSPEPSLESLANLLQSALKQGSVDEACLFRYRNRWECYTVRESQHRDFLTGFPGGLDIRQKEVDREAVRIFFLHALGAGTPEIGEYSVLETLTRDFRACLNTDLPGPVLHNLHDRAIRLGHDLRDSTELSEGAVTPPELSRELAGKILESESEAVVTVTGEQEIIRDFIRIWDEANVQQLYCVHQNFEEAESICRSVKALPIRWEDRRELLLQSDVIILASHNMESLISEDVIRRNLQHRKRRHLLVFDWSDTFMVEGNVERMPSVFAYSKADLQKALVQAREKRERMLEQQRERITNAVDQFYRWAYSDERYQFHGIVGRSHRMQRVFELIRRVAQTDITVLLQGETGTGKEMVARAIHQSSERSAGPFVPVNCGAIPETLLESELFGHVRGAFTGAMADRQGLLQEAESGTVFLDEIGDTSEAFQVKLLRALQEREILPLGSSQPVPIHVRIIAATGRDLEEAVEKDDFRSDLYYRINVVKIELPPLRERRKDILPLVRHFMHQFNQKMGKRIRDISDTAATSLENYSWPGNVRELENAIERAVALTLGHEITPADLPESITSPKPRRESATLREGVKTLEEVEADYIGKLLREFEGNYSEVAEKLGIGRTTLWRKMKKYGFSEND